MLQYSLKQIAHAGKKDNTMPSLTQTDLAELQTIITAVVREELLPRFARVTRQHKTDGSILTEADLAMQHRLQHALHTRWPHIPMLGEEMTDEQQTSLLSDTSAGLWCLDPLDGTSNFAAGVPFFSVSLSLIQNGAVTLGLVFDPIREECFTACRNGGAFLNGQTLQPTPAPPLEKCIGLIDFKRLPAPLAQRLVSQRPYSSQRSFGSVALDWCWIAAGRCHVYLHGKQRLWDYGAGQLILSETGGHACTLEGTPLPTDDLTPRSAVAALDGELFSAWRQWLGISLEPAHLR